MARNQERSERLHLFAYEAGAAMVGATAAARRVALPFSDLGATGLTTEGWQLFDAAVAWAVGDSG